MRGFMTCWAPAARLLGQCSLSSPDFFSTPTTFLYLLWPSLCCLLAWPYYRYLLTLPLSCIDFPCGPLSPSHSSYIARGLFYPEDGGDTLLRNVGSHKTYTATRPRKQFSSCYILLKNISRRLYVSSRPKCWMTAPERCLVFLVLEGSYVLPALTNLHVHITRFFKCEYALAHSLNRCYYRDYPVAIFLFLFDIYRVRQLSLSPSADWWLSLYCQIPLLPVY
jgi:hypothetical protein